MFLEKVVNCDVTVIGAGLAGTCAAIAAARNGSKVALVQDRSVLGGNASREIRMIPLGATGGGNKYAEEMGIIGELKLENQYKNPDGNAYIWDSILLDFVLAEKNIQLFLNSVVSKVETEESKIISATATQLASETTIKFISKVYIDSTGDGTVGMLAGAQFMRGEDNPKPGVDRYVMGNTMYYEVKDAGKPVRYVPPRFAYSREKIEEILKNGDKEVDEKMSGFDFWWIEYGGIKDTIHDNEEIKYELQRFIYGLWDYVKNSGKFNAENLTLGWIGSVPGKRESRRLLGDYVLTKEDLQQQTPFEDAVTYGGWPIDLHPEEGMYSKLPSCRQSRVNPYSIPFRSLYAKDVDNLLFAGRNISATQEAFASLRIMNSCALLGQAAGTAGALATKFGVLPRELGKRYIKELQQTLLKQDCIFFGQKNEDNNDIAKQSKVSSSGFRQFKFENAEGVKPAIDDCFMILPSLSEIGTVEVLVAVLEDSDANFEVFISDKPQNYTIDRKVNELNLSLKKCKSQWIKIDTGLKNNKNNVIIKLHKNPNIAFYCSKDVYTGSGVWLKSDTNRLPMYLYPCIKVEGNTDVYSHNNVIDGYNRPFGLPSVWSSARMDDGSQWIELDFGKEQNINEVILYFNPDLNREYFVFRPTLFNKDAYLMPKELVKSYKVFAIVGGDKNEIACVEENYQRRNLHKFDSVKAEKLRIEIQETWGSPYAEIFEVRVY